MDMSEVSFDESLSMRPDSLNEAMNSSLSTYRTSPQRSPLRKRYEAEVEVIQKKLGNLEVIRQELGLSRRKMCELLMVDPSAWTRWSKEGSAPPHIYRALQWYLALIDKQPEWHPQNSFQGAAKILNERQLVDLSAHLKKQWQKEGLLSRSWDALEELRTEWQGEKAILLDRIQKADQLSSTWKMALLINTCALVGMFLYIVLA